MKKTLLAAAALGLALPAFAGFAPEPAVVRKRTTAAERKAAEPIGPNPFSPAG